MRPMSETSTTWGARICACVTAGIALAALAGPAEAATIRPTTEADDVSVNANCTLREAVIAANTDAAVDACPAGDGGDRIPLGSHPNYPVTLPTTNENGALNGDLDITDDLKLVGRRSVLHGEPFRENALVGDGTDRVLDVHSGAQVTVKRLELGSDGTIAGEGGAIRLEGLNTRVRLVEAWITESGSGPAGGGAVELDAGQTLEVIRTTIVQNFTEGEGGAIDLDAGSDLIVTDSAIYGNQAEDAGGGIEIGSGSDAVITNSAIADNEVRLGATIAGAGGGIRVNGDAQTDVQLINSTVAHNRAEFGGGIHMLSADGTTAKGTLVAENLASGSGPDCGGPGDLDSLGHNLIGVASPPCAFGETATDITDVNARLRTPGGELVSREGGPTRTVPLRSESPAVGSGPPDAPARDQRGVRRRGPDIGAYELARCAGAIVNRVGTERADLLMGTGGPDGILGFGGNDQLRSRGGRDGICAGGGHDVAHGGGGAGDKVRGQKGNDLLGGGGGGRDLCDGGPGNDSANSSCERTRGVP